MPRSPLRPPCPKLFPRPGCALLAANAGFLLAGGLSEAAPGLEAIPRMKLHLGAGALGWLNRRLETDGG